MGIGRGTLEPFARRQGLPARSAELEGGLVGQLLRDLEIVGGLEAQLFGRVAEDGPLVAAAPGDCEPCHGAQRRTETRPHRTRRLHRPDVVEHQRDDGVAQQDADQAVADGVEVPGRLESLDHADIEGKGDLHAGIGDPRAPEDNPGRDRGASGDE